VIGLQPDQGELRILVVDDKEPNRRLLSRMLGAVGFQVREAGDGEEAIAAFEAWNPHLIFMDMVMPGMDGYEATRRIKATDRGRETAIVAITASAFEEDREKVLSTGADAFVRKPFREQELFEQIREQLGIEYVYADAEPSGARTPATERASALTHESLAGLPSALVDQMRKATIGGDIHRLNQLIGQVEAYDERVAQGLRNLAKAYEYDLLLSILQGKGVR
jgi:CheY-like chemotaxis protein